MKWFFGILSLLVAINLTLAISRANNPLEAIAFVERLLTPENTSTPLLNQEERLTVPTIRITGEPSVEVEALKKD